MSVPMALDSDSDDEWPGPDVPGSMILSSESVDVTLTYDDCLQKITEIFPDVSQDHVRKLWDKRLAAAAAKAGVSQSIIHELLESGSYPKEKDRLKELKRKRASPEVEAARWKYHEFRDDPIEYASVAKAVLNHHFDTVPTKYIADVFKMNPNYYQAFFAIDKAVREHDGSSHTPYVKLKHRRNSTVVPSHLIRGLEAGGHDFESLKEEMRSAERRWQKEEDNRQQAKQSADAKEARDEEHRRKGEVMTCGCCFTEDVPISQVTHCAAEEAHFFCFECARRNAENDIGSMKYALSCMDISRCQASFGREQRKRFLDTATIAKLERIQQQDEIRRAEMENLELCPFCDYAAVCPPVAVDKEFRCQNPECGETSCRTCKQKTHIPLSCEEFKKENGISQRRVIEEARTEALLRTCKKCNIRILKEDGCNKVVCTGCYSVICDYCGQDISKAKYEHFDGGFRGAPATKGKCPLYDSSRQRKENQIEQAGKEAMEKVRQENPDLSEEDLRIKFAKAVESQSRHQLENEAVMAAIHDPLGARLGALVPALPGHIPGGDHIAQRRGANPDMEQRLRERTNARNEQLHQMLNAQVRMVHEQHQDLMQRQRQAFTQQRARVAQQLEDLKRQQRAIELRMRRGYPIVNPVVANQNPNSNPQTARSEISPREAEPVVPEPANLRSPPYSHQIRHQRHGSRGQNWDRHPTPKGSLSSSNPAQNQNFSTFPDLPVSTQRPASIASQNPQQTQQGTANTFNDAFSPPVFNNHDAPPQMRYGQPPFPERYWMHDPVMQPPPVPFSGLQFGPPQPYHTHQIPQFDPLAQQNHAPPPPFQPHHQAQFGVEPIRGGPRMNDPPTNRPGHWAPPGLPFNQEPGQYWGFPPENFVNTNRLDPALQSPVASAEGIRLPTAIPTEPPQRQVVYDLDAEDAAIRAYTENGQIGRHAFVPASARRQAIANAMPRSVQDTLSNDSNRARETIDLDGDNGLWDNLGDGVKKSRPGI